MTSKRLDKNPTRRQVKQALDFYADELDKLVNVTGLGIVELNNEENISKNSGLGIAVYVEKKVHSDELPPDQIIPSFLELKIRGGMLAIPTKVIEQGTISLE